MTRKPAPRCGKTVPPAALAGFTPHPAFRSGHGRAKQVQEFLPSLTKPAFERYGFSSAEILTNWVAYAGADFAAYTAPERLKWPRQDGGEGAHAGATLILRVSGARALEVQHKSGQLMQRVNAAFGYRAVTAIRILQAPLPEPAVKRSARRLGEETPAPLLSIADERLRAALCAISSGIAERRTGAGGGAHRTRI